jgi:eukaryotic-like serine/threonine-protein kinase
MPLRRRRVEDDVTETRVAQTADEEIVEEQVPPPPPPRIWPWLLLLLLLVVGGLAAYFLLTRGEDKTTMPNVIGLREDQARARLAEAQLEADVDRRPSRRPRGIVFAQVPGAGAQLNEGERVEILVSSQLARIPVPSVEDLSAAEARQMLEAAGFEVRVRRVFAGAPRGRVIEQDPRGGDRAPRGSTVEVLVSKGRNLNRVPDVVGMQEDAAVQALRAREFAVRIFDVPSEEPRGTVVAQVPRGGVLGPPDARVRINVSSGEPTGTPQERQQTQPGETTAEVRIPNVVGLAQTSALGRLRNAGLNGVVTFARSSQPRGRVVRQTPAAGRSAARNSDVRLVVSAGSAAARETVPDVVALDQAAATQALEDAGFIVDVIRVLVEDPAEDGVVTDQQPQSGTKAPRGAVVTIFVGLAG